MKNCYMILSVHLVSSSQIQRFHLHFAVYLLLLVLLIIHVHVWKIKLSRLSIFLPLLYRFVSFLVFGKWCSHCLWKVSTIFTAYLCIVLCFLKLGHLCELALVQFSLHLEVQLTVGLRTPYFLYVSTIKCLVPLNSYLIYLIRLNFGQS